MRLIIEGIKLAAGIFAFLILFSGVWIMTP
jgi:hypothetical protein